MATERATLNAVVRSLAVLSSSWRCAGDWRQVERRQTTGHRDRGRLPQSARDQVSQFHAFQTCCVRSGSSTVHTDQQCTSLPLIDVLIHSSSSVCYVLRHFPVALCLPPLKKLSTYCIKFYAPDLNLFRIQQLTSEALSIAIQQQQI